MPVFPQSSSPGLYKHMSSAEPSCICLLLPPALQDAQQLAVPVTSHDSGCPKMVLITPEWLNLAPDESELEKSAVKAIN